MKYGGVMIIGCMMLFSCAGQQPEYSGVRNGLLAACPATPNCVCSQATDEDHAIAPFDYQGEKEMAVKRLKKAIASVKGATIVAESDHYLHIEFKSLVMGFIDDVEFFFPREKVIHVRSASRIGYSDFGVNRKRVEQLRKLFDSGRTDVQG